MPYIKTKRRNQLEVEDGFIPVSSDNPGDLNYMITKLIIRYCDEHGLNYQRINDVIGALEGAKLEFYRRVAAPYESLKIVENGDLDYYSHFSPVRSSGDVK